MGKGEIAHYEQLLFFPQCFQKACFPGASNGVIVWEWVNRYSAVLCPFEVVFKKKKMKELSALVILYYLYSFYFPLYPMYQLNAMAFYMLHFLRIKASVNIYNVNVKLKMLPTTRKLDWKDSHQQSMLSYLPSKRLKTNNEDKENSSKISFRTSYTI